MVYTRSLLLSALAGLTAVNAIPTIEVKGSKFFTSEGNQFYVKGIAYQLVPEDPLIDATQCRLDATLMKTIGTNSIRVYHVDPNGDHTGCMKAFADAGIYLWLDLDTFTTQIEQTSPHWNQGQRDSFAKVMDEFHQFDNTAGFFVGNEILTTANGSAAAPYVKAAARDLKAHRTSKGYRNIPVGYSAADIASLRPMLQNYLACGDKAAETIDFFSLNAYSWCGGSTYEQSGYKVLEQNSTDLHIPIFMSETGCNTVRPRDFKDQEAIYGEMSDVWSGSIVYEWIEEANNYGLIKYGDKVDPAGPSAPPDGFPRSGTPTPISPDFPNLGNVWKTLNPSGVKASNYNPTNKPVACPDFTSGVWEVNPTSALPTLGQVHTFGSQATGTSGSGSSGSSKPSGSSATGTAGQASATASPGAAPKSLSRELKGMGAALAGLMAVFAWL
ncbi:glycoside hydrolase family 72 protein [Cucurbitaria berberidis CBS 394.84]|uniref:1,3-beta-glucanosyltransferase n=1 Tax=Cucurbitaria berberidis CBS 394.84 TaxID=1168544 RepID=A0A9P4GPJ9_9PLEO|nr:glycoside hydrolase family 72 protein [Cucurbitaria berberidis CBS 394.84]KAF1848845.1 glycoside hydrolase family 72 protein [Cucurbitaria berberidis CBS 394.84]